MYMIRAAIFDVDGTLLDTMPVWENAGEIFLKKHGIQAEAQLGKKLYKMSMQEGAEYLRSRYGLDISPKGIIDGVAEVVIDFYRYEAQFKPGAREFLEALRAKDIPMAIATANEKSTVETALERLGTGGYFTEILTCSALNTSKMKPDIFMKAADVLGAHPFEAWVFEDSYHAAKTARDAGFRVAAVYDRYSEDELEQLKQAADIYMEEYWDFEKFYKEAFHERQVGI